MKTMRLIHLSIALVAMAMIYTMPIYAQEDATEEPVVKVKFDPLVMFNDLDGSCTVKYPNEDVFEPVKRNHAYPFGTTFKMADIYDEDGEIVEKAGVYKLYFNALNYLKIRGESEVTIQRFTPTNDDGEQVNAVGIQVKCGIVDVRLLPELPKYSVCIGVPSGLFTSIAGSAVIEVRKDRTLTEVASNEPVADLRFDVATGNASFQGIHYSIPLMRTSNAFTEATYGDLSDTVITGKGGEFDVVFPNADLSNTVITGKGGKFDVVLPNGGNAPTIFSLGNEALIKINRLKAKLGGRWVINVLTILSGGKAKNTFTYAEGQPVVRTGDLISEDLPDQVAEEGEGTEEPVEETLDEDFAI